ncbi:MAG: ThuA domain-containing protein [Pirellulales bacterium]|nr:ThuA domain-containing protein [Pirellulales bacterium]
MRRREMLIAAGAAVVGLSARFSFAEEEKEKKAKILFFSRSAGFEHPPIARKGKELSSAEKQLVEWGKAKGYEVVCGKDGALFDGDLDQYDAFVFYTSGDLTGKTRQPQPGGPMSAEGKKKLLEAVRDGKGFVGIHSATDTFHSDGIDPYIAMIGGEFITHGRQQEAVLKVVSPEFPGMEGLDEEFTIHDEWYAQNKFPKDMHVILLQRTEGMEGKMYRRPPYPAVWARMHGKGRVFYTALGHGPRNWDNPTFKQILLGGIDWATRKAGPDVEPNIEKVAPGANEAAK